MKARACQILIGSPASVDAEASARTIAQAKPVVRLTPERTFREDQFTEISTTQSRRKRRKEPKHPERVLKIWERHHRLDNFQ